MIRCLNCGTTNNDENKFCSKCGNPLINSNINDYQNDNQQQNYEQRRVNDPRKIDEHQHVNNNQPQENYQQRGSNDPRRIDERQHTFKQPVNNQQPVNYKQPSNTYNNNQSNTTKNKLLNLSTPVKIIGLIALCCIGVLIVSALGGSTSDQGSLPSSYNSYNSNSYGSVFDSFSQADCREINYKELDKNPDRYTGDNIKIRGRVMQISEGNSGGNYLLMYVNDNYDQLAYVEYYNNTNIVEDDYITVYGVCGGSYSYTTQIGSTNTVPSVYGAILNRS